MNIHRFVIKYLGLLALLLATAPAHSGGFGTVGDFIPIPELTLHQVGVPADVLSPPFHFDRDAGLIANATDHRPHGIIYAQHLGGARIDFLVSGIRNDVAVDVFIAYSTRPGNEVDSAPGLSGRFRLDMPSMRILAGIYAQPINHFLQHEPTPLGRSEVKTRSVVLTVWLSDLNAPQFQGDEIFFQALAVPAGSLNLNESQASEVDHFIINRDFRPAPPPFE